LVGQNEWNGFVPLVTTRAQVESEIGKPTKYGKYVLDDEEVRIIYTERQCGNPKHCECLAPTGSILYISRYLNNTRKVSEIDLKGFGRTVDTHLPDVYTYSNHEIGIVYTVQNEEVYKIRHYRSERVCSEYENEIPSLMKKGCLVAN